MLSSLTIAQALYKNIPNDMDSLRPLSKRCDNILIPEVIIPSLTDFHLALLPILSKEINDFNIIVTSTDIVYNGQKRTMEDGPSHVMKQAIDLVLSDKDCPGTIICNGLYSRSLLWMGVMFDIFKKHKLTEKVTLGFEPSHFHFHLKRLESEPTFVVFENYHQIKGLLADNSQFMAKCQGHKPKDITPFLFHLFT